jgi:competence protein ComEA
LPFTKYWSLHLYDATTPNILKKGGELMNLFVKKNTFTLLIAISTILLAILVWQFIQGGDKAARLGFTPLNEQMEQLIDQPKDEIKGNYSGSTNKAAQPTANPTANPTAQPTADKKPDNKPESVRVKPGSDGTMKSKEQLADKVELNSANLEQLDALPGIGESKAKAILAYRQESGGFKRVEELAEIKGIGEKMLAKLKPLVYVAIP